MNKLLTPLLVLAVIGITMVGLVASEVGETDEAHEQEHEEEFDWDDNREPAEEGGATPAAYSTDPGSAPFESECESCYLAFLPSMLPGASWNGMMNALGDHLGDNAERDTRTAGQLANFLARNGACAEQGDFDGHRVPKPGYSHWDD